MKSEKEKKETAEKKRPSGETSQHKNYGNDKQTGQPKSDRGKERTEDQEDPGKEPIARKKNDDDMTDTEGEDQDYGSSTRRGRS